MRLSPAVAFAGCTLIWGTTWLAIKIGYRGLAPLWGAGLRFWLAAALLAPLAFAQRRATPSGRRTIAVVAIAGLLIFAGNYGLIYWGEQWLPSGLTAVLYAVLPLFTALFGLRLAPGEPASGRFALGSLVGLAGLAVLFAHDLTADAALAGPMLAVVVAAALGALASLLIQRLGAGVPPVVLTSGGMALGAAALTLASLLAGERRSWPETTESWLALLHLVLLGSVLAFLLYWHVLHAWGAKRASLGTLIFPLVALATGLLFGERLPVRQWLGALAVLLGVAISLRAAPSARRAPAT